MGLKLVIGIKRFMGSDRFKEWMRRLTLPVLALIIFIVLTTLYNIWTNLTSFANVRRDVTTLATGSLLFGPAVFWRTRVQAWYLSAMSLVLALLFTANAVYASYAGGFLAASTLSYLWQASDTTGSIRSLLEPRLIIYFLPAIGFAIAGIMAGRLRSDWHFDRLKRSSALIATAGIIVVTSLGYGYFSVREIQQYGDLSRITNHPFDSTELVQKIGIINYNVLDLIHYVFRKRSISTDEVKYIEDHRADQIVPQTPNDVTGKLAGRNVIYLQLESFQEFLIGLKINGQEVTPNLNKLAAASHNFTNFNYDVGPGTSSDAEFVTFTSLLPLSNESVVFDYPTNNYRAYPDLLRKAGYTTQAYHGDSKNFWNRAATFPNFGFDHYTAEDEYKIGPGDEVGLGLSDKVFVNQTLDKISQLKQPFYAHMITVSSHTPFSVPKKDEELDLSNVKLDPLQKGYLQTARYTDDAIGELMDGLAQRGLSDKTALVLMGDHEGFLFKKDDTDFAKFLGHENGFDDLTNLHSRTIPFMIYAPGAGIEAQDNQAASQVDIYPTLMNLLGVKTPTGLFGVDLFGGQPATATRRVRGVGTTLEMAERGDLTYVGQGVADNKPACYQGSNKVAVTDCNALKDRATVRSLMSDYAIWGNRVDLLNLKQ